MQASRTHMALVIDEYGGTDGLVSIEDVMEAIVGDIEDEHDEDETPELHASGDGGWIADARAPLDAVSEAAGFDFSSLPEAEEVDTIGGLITAAAGRVPDRGEILQGPGEFEYEVLDADPRRIKRVKIRPLAARPPPTRLRRRGPRRSRANLPKPPARRGRHSLSLRPRRFSMAKPSLRNGGGRRTAGKFIPIHSPPARATNNRMIKAVARRVA